MTSEQVTVEINADDNASGKLSDVADNAEGMGARVESALKGAEDASKKFALALGVAATAALALGFNALQEFNQAEQVGARLEQLIFNQEGATAAHVQALYDQAAAMQKVTTYGDDLILMAQSQFATFDISSESIQKLIPGFLDMAAAEKGAAISMEEMKQLSQGFGKALVGQADALIKQGFIFTDLQKQILKTGTEQEKVAVITEVLGRTYDGMAETLRNTFQGQVEVAKNTMSDFMEIIGSTIADVLWPAIHGFNRWTDSIGGADGMMRRFVEIIKTVQPYWFLIAGAIVGALIPALYGMLAATSANVVALAPFIAAGAAVAAVAYLIYQAYETNFLGFQGIVTSVINAMMPVVQSLLDFWTLFTMGLTQAFNDLKFAWETAMFGIQATATAVWNGIQLFLSGVLNVMKGLFKVALGVITLNWQTAWEGLNLIAIGSFELITLGIRAFWDGVNALWKLGSDAVASGWGSMMDGIASVAARVWEGIKQTFKDGINAIIRFVNGFIETYNAALDKVPGGRNLKLPTFTPLAEGGIVTRPTFALIGEAGPEAVVPLKKGGAAGVGTTIILQGNSFYGNADESFAQQIGDTLVKMLQPHLSYASA
jgi:hypothetical protein